MSDFKTVLVRDSVIGDITSDLDFAVKSGASQTTSSVPSHFGFQLLAYLFNPSAERKM